MECGGAGSTSPGARRKPGRGRTTDLHKRLIADYVAIFPGTQTHGFNRELRAWATKNRRDLKTNLNGRWVVEQFRFVPDAFRFDHERANVTLVEAQHTSLITLAKWDALLDFFWFVDGAEWSLDLRLIDRSGAIFLADIALLAHAHLARHVPSAATFLECLPNDPPGRHVPAEGFVDCALKDPFDDEVRP